MTYELPHEVLVGPRLENQFIMNLPPPGLQLLYPSQIAIPSKPQSQACLRWLVLGC
jgi:hypothetical protein